MENDPTMKTLLPAVFLYLALTVSAAARDNWELTQVQAMFVQAVAHGDIAKARYLAQLGNIDPNNLNGHTLASHLSNTWWGKAFPALWSDQTFDYVYGELKQDANVTAVGGDRSVFSMMCLGMMGDGTIYTDPNVVFPRAIQRIRRLIAAGAKVTEHEPQKPSARRWQPLPTCLDQYESLQPASPFKQPLLELIDLYLSKGANPNYSYKFNNSERRVPLTVAIRHFDVELLEVLLKHKADIKLTFQAQPPGCNSDARRTSTTDTLLADILEPRDQDVGMAEPFLRAFAAAGGDIATPIFSCRHGTKTLKEMAIDNGQVAYAKMAQQVALVNSLPPDATAPSRVAPQAASPADMMAVLTGIASNQPLKQVYANINSFNEPVEQITINLVPRLTVPCALTVDATRDVSNSRFRGPLDHQRTTFVYDFAKMESVTAAWTTDYEEGLLSALGGGPRKPRNYLEIKLKGKGAACFLDKDGKPTKCGDTYTPFWHIIDTRVTPAQIAGAFQRVRAACRPAVTTTAMSTTDAEAPSDMPMGPRDVIDTANVRATPSRNGALAGTLKVGDRITVDGVSSDQTWFRVAFPGGSGWVLARVLAKSTKIAGNEAQPERVARKSPTVLAACPGTITSVDVEAEAGKYNPPALLAPTSDNGRMENGLINFRAEWTGLGGQNAVLHCRMSGDGERLVDVALPPEVTTCVRANNKVTCF